MNISKATIPKPKKIQLETSNTESSETRLGSETNDVEDKKGSNTDRKVGRMSLR